MFIVIWNYQVKENAVKAFEKMYGKNGNWVHLFNKGSGYRGTELLRQKQAQHSYITIDRWESEARYLAFYDKFRQEIQQIDKEGDKLTLKEAKLGSFEEVG